MDFEAYKKDRLENDPGFRAEYEREAARREPERSRARLARDAWDKLLAHAADGLEAWCEEFDCEMPKAAPGFIGELQQGLAQSYEEPADRMAQFIIDWTYGDWEKATSVMYMVALAFIDEVKIESPQSTWVSNGAP